MKEVKRFKCNFCTRLTAKKETMEKHEKMCKHNPNGFNCWMCKKAYAGEVECSDGLSVRNAVLCKFIEDEITANIAKTCPEYDRDKYMYDERGFRR